jgi:hypothetical protein
MQENSVAMVSYPDNIVGPQSGNNVVQDQATFEADKRAVYKYVSLFIIYISNII